MNWNYKDLVASVPHKHRYLYNDNDQKVGVVLVLKNGAFGWSVCSKKDTFNKKYGKAIAILRAQSGKVHLDNVPTIQYAEQIVHKLHELGVQF